MQVTLFPLLTLWPLLLASVLLLGLGLRGKCIGTHPYCRRCGYDLIGRPETSDRCPECGIGLRLRRAIRIGQRRRPPLPIAAGITLLIASGIGFAPAGQNLFWHIYMGLVPSHFYVRLELRNEIRPGAPLPLDIVANAPRPFGVTGGAMHAQVTSVSFDASPLVLGAPTGADAYDFYSGWRGNTYNNDFENVAVPGSDTAHLAPGKHVLHARVKADVTLDVGRRSYSSTRWQDVSATFHVVASKTPLVALIEEPEQRAAMRACFISTRVLSINCHTSVVFRIENPPYPLVSRVLLRFNGHEVQVGNTEASGWQGDASVEGNIGPIPSPTADVIFRPDPAAAEYNRDLAKIWGEEIVFPNVPISKTH